MHKQNIVGYSTVKNAIGNRNATRFWTDVWVGTRSLNERFPCVYAMESDKQCMVGDRWVDEQWRRNWHRRMPDSSLTSHQYIDMQQSLQYLELSDHGDTWECTLQQDGSFVVACIVSILTKKFFIQEIQTRWNNLVPIKRIFRLDQPVFEVMADVFNWIDAINIRQKAIGFLEVIFISVMWVMWQYRNNVIFEAMKMKKSIIFDRIVFEWFSSRAEEKMFIIIGLSCYTAQNDYL
ncbi:hypothetical protein CTI12_AA538290 [Artemisia annua]|uniref:RNA-directed DNA polymerase, eukaryota, Reverse transcriptase zinc-binding domain protein n=1 Tax=Artemisia annua TaxID=35608 RepID=A0A2U1L2C9_ARTAN|nr:hypothetical protein CTI12_AA538290 [Artemisia annua]